MKFERVAKWNAARYEQKFNDELQTKLACEEFSETVDAKDEVERLDGHVDQIYVAMGGLWKLGLESAEAYNFLEAATAYSDLAMCDLEYDEVVQCIGECIDNISVATGPRQALALANIVALNYRALMLYGYSPSECMQAADIVCDSNDSKSIKKVASNVKANDGDKGAFFIDPKPRLQVIADAMQSRRQ